MGGFIGLTPSVPSPPPPAPVQAPPPPPPPAPLPDPNAAQNQARLDAMDRQRRGLAGTVATSDAGLLTGSDPNSTTLLGA